jgi:copper resistance protein D
VTLHELLLPAIGRWLGLLALALLVGGLVVDLFVLPRHAAQLAAARRRLWLWGVLAVAVLIVTSAGDLIARARIMSGGDLSQAAAALPLVLTRTHFGAIWVVRAVTLVLLIVVSVSRAVPFRAAGLVLSLGVALSLSLTGHAADSGDYSLSVLIDWLHAIAATMWTGGLFGLVLTMCRDQGAWPRELVGIVAQRFSRLAGYCLLVVLATGIYNTWVQVPSFAALWTTTYGVALLLKICLALVLASLGAINRYGVLPALGVMAARRAAAAEKLSRFVVREALVAIVVFGCTAVLAESTPKSHEGHMSHGAAHGGSSEEPF